MISSIPSSTPPVLFQFEFGFQSGCYLTFHHMKVDITIFSCNSAANVWSNLHLHYTHVEWQKWKTTSISTVFIIYLIISIIYPVFLFNYLMSSALLLTSFQTLYCKRLIITPKLVVIADSICGCIFFLIKSIYSFLFIYLFIHYSISKYPLAQHIIYLKFCI